MKSFIKTSIVLCTYNGAKYLQEQLDSIIAQTYPIHEYIMVDDCSTDQTMNILQGYGQKYSNWRIYQNEKNIGYNKNFEKALQLATGDVIAICDQDDIWNKDKIKIMLENWKDNTPLIYCESIRFTDYTPTKLKTNKWLRKFEGTDGRKLFIQNVISGHNIIFKKDLLKLALPFKQNIYYDWWLSVVAAYNGGVTYLPKILVYYRIHDKNATVNTNMNTSIKRVERKKLIKQKILPCTEQFIHTPNIPSKHKIFAQNLHYLWGQGLQQKFHWPLFFFLLRYRRYIFFYKKRRIGILSHIKHSFIFTYNY